MISKKAGKETFVDPIINGKDISFVVKQSKHAPEGTVKRSGAKCICCGQPVGFPHIREEGKNNRIGAKLIAVVGLGNRGACLLFAFGGTG
jgi:putative DNA methylase